MVAKVKCEFLKEGNCNSIVENDEAKEVRKNSCNNDNEQACCYLCSYYQKCEISCNFLGENKKKSNKKQSSDSIEENKIRVLRCPLCNSKMLHSEIKIRIGGWSGIMQALPLGSLGELGEKLLPVVLYFCPKCGKLEFKAQAEKESEGN